MQRVLLPPRKPQRTRCGACSQPGRRCQTCWPWEFCSIFSRIMCLLGFIGREGKSDFTAWILKGSGIRSVNCVLCSQTCLLIANKILKAQKCLKLCYILACSFVPWLPCAPPKQWSCSKWFLVRQGCMIPLNHNMSLVWVLSWCVPVCGIWEICSLFFIRQPHGKIKLTWRKHRGSVGWSCRDHCTCCACWSAQPGRERHHWLVINHPWRCLGNLHMLDGRWFQGKESLGILSEITPLMPSAFLGKAGL